MNPGPGYYDNDMKKQASGAKIGKAKGIMLEHGTLLGLDHTAWTRATLKELSLEPVKGSEWEKLERLAQGHMTL